MINLSLDELRVIAQIRNISDYENKSEVDLIKALSEPKPETKPKLETKPKWKLKIKVNKKKLEKIRKDFDELRHKFSKKEIDRYRKAFYNVKNYKNLSLSEIKEAGKSLTKLKKVWGLKNFTVILIALNVKTLIIMITIMILLMMNIEKLEALENYLSNLIVIITNQ